MLPCPAAPTARFRPLLPGLLILANLLPAAHGSGKLPRKPAGHAGQSVAVETKTAAADAGKQALRGRIAQLKAQRTGQPATTKPAAKPGPVLAGGLAPGAEKSGFEIVKEVKAVVAGAEFRTRNAAGVEYRIKPGADLRAADLMAPI